VAKCRARELRIDSPEGGRSCLVLDERIKLITRKGLAAPERLLMDAAPSELAGLRIACGLDRSGLVALALGAVEPSAELSDFQLDAYRAEKIERTFAEHEVVGRVVLGADLSELGEGFDLLFLPFPNTFERQLGREIIEQAASVLRPDGALYAATDGKDEWLRGVLKDVMDGATRVGGKRSKGFVWKARPKCKASAARNHARPVELELNEVSLSLTSRPGVFGYGRIDSGTRALLERIELEGQERILDLGCGYGPLGLYAAKKAPEGSVVLVDSHARATALAEQNRLANGIENAEVLLRANAENLGPEDFDLVLANPPYFSNLRIAAMFVERAVQRLKPEGRLLMVAKAGEKHRRVMADRFAEVTLIERRGYGVLEGRRPKR